MNDKEEESKIACIIMVKSIIVFFVLFCFISPAFLKILCSAIVAEVGDIVFYEQ